MHRFIIDVLAIIIGTVIGMLIYERLKKRDAFSEYVPSIEGFEKMNVQSPDDANFSRGTLDTL